jgi:hypothetical protein
MYDYYLDDEFLHCHGLQAVECVAPYSLPYSHGFYAVERRSRAKARK